MGKVKLIQGNPERAEEIKKTFEEWGGENRFGYKFDDKSSYFYIDVFGNVIGMIEYSAYDYIKKGKAEIYELPPLQPKCALKPFGKVLVRDFDADEWRCDFFSHYRDGLFYCVGNHWEQCVKYEGNEYLLGTSKEPERCD